MRRYIFYLFVALLTFGLGIFFLYLSSFGNSEMENVAGNEPQKSAADSFSNGVALHQETGIESLISDKEKALILFEPTLKKWLQKESVPATVEPSPEILERIMATKLHRYEAPYLIGTARESYKPSLIDLNRDGISELFILVSCGKPDGCELWIFRETRLDFEVILRTTERFEKFEIKKNKSKGFLDIQTSYYPNDPESETLKSMDNYKFDGQRYNLSGCSEYVNRYRDKNGVLQYLKRPILYHLKDCC